MLGSSLAWSVTRGGDSIFCGRGGCARSLLNCASVGNPNAKRLAQTAPDEERARDRFAILLVSLLAILALGPFLKGPLGHFLVKAYFTIVLLSALFSMREERLLFRVGLVTGAPALLTMWLGEQMQVGSKFAVAAALTAVFLGVMAVGLVRRAMAPGRVTMSRILASLCAYLMIGLAWAEVYAAVAVVSPGSFNSSRGWSQMGAADVVTRSVYFSFVTLTTLGYGDITPATDATRSLAVTEAIVGQLFLTVMVARLVGLFVAHEHSGAGDD